MAEPRWLDPLEARAWRGWIELSELVRTRLAHDLWAQSRLSEADYAVLVHLSEAPAHRVRMTDMAAALRWSKSRLSHQVGRMEKRGQIAREGCPSDARGAFAVLTATGLREITAAAPGHVESARHYLIDLLTPEQQAGLADITEALLAHHQAACAGAGDDTACADDDTAGGPAGKLEV